MADALLRRMDAGAVRSMNRRAVDEATVAGAARIVADVREGGEAALRRHAERWDGLGRGEPLIVEQRELRRALDRLGREDRTALERMAARIERFASAQRAALADIEIEIPGGSAGHRVAPMDVAGCYAPGGRFPLPSSALMTAVPARVAGVREVWMASPRPADATLAAAAIAGVGGLLRVGGAQAIAALAHGVGGVPRSDIVVGPGNRWVTAAKKAVFGDVAIDMLAGPSEVLIIADRSANLEMVAADLLAQAEHDEDASVVLIALDDGVIEDVESALRRQLETLPTADTALQALRNSCAVQVSEAEKACALSDAVAPEHLQLAGDRAATLADHVRNFGALFIGERAAEVIGDYGAGPNHTLPTGGSARSFSGLSVLDFLRVRTWIRMESAGAERDLYADAARLARVEGLEAHARAAELRIGANAQ